MKITFKANKLLSTKSENALLIEPLSTGELNLEEKCQVHATIEGEKPPVYSCVDKSCGKKCVLHKRDLGDGKEEHWCTCD